jgi:hypothetical protein
LETYVAPNSRMLIILFKMRLSAIFPDTTLSLHLECNYPALPIALEHLTTLQREFRSNSVEARMQQSDG